tara:strand:- start:260 stop:475 length:216 start_codon:yes stop_codon:yes gene_type:complete
MSESVNPCKKCDGFGAYSDYIAGRVYRVYCDCEAGKRFRERIAEESEDMMAANSFIEDHRRTLQKLAEIEE